MRMVLRGLRHGLFYQRRELVEVALGWGSGSLALLAVCVAVEGSVLSTKIVSLLFETIPCGDSSGLLSGLPGNEIRPVVVGMLVFRRCCRLGPASVVRLFCRV